MDSPSNLLSSTLISCLIPPSKLQNSFLSEIYLIDSFGFICSNRIAFLYQENAVIHSLKPSMGYANSTTTLSIFGSNFKNDSVIKTCRFEENGHVEHRTATFVSSSSLKCLSASLKPVSTSVKICFYDDTYCTDSAVQFNVRSKFFVFRLKPSRISSTGGALITVAGSL